MNDETVDKEHFLSFKKSHTQCTAMETTHKVLRHIFNFSAMLFLSCSTHVQDTEKLGNSQTFH